MAADKIMILRREDMSLKVLSNNPALMVEIEDVDSDDENFETRVEREYPYEVFNEGGVDDEEAG